MRYTDKPYASNIYCNFNSLNLGYVKAVFVIAYCMLPE